MTLLRSWDFCPTLASHSGSWWLTNVLSVTDCYGASVARYASGGSHMCWGNAPYACRCIASEDHVSSHLWIVMPVYNEQESVGGVFAEWLPALRQLGISFTLLALNDGSIDDTLAILQRVARANSEVEVVDKPNSGHGPTCIVGYRHALAAGAEWVLQIDSDGQCDPRYLA